MNPQSILPTNSAGRLVLRLIALVAGLAVQMPAVSADDDDRDDDRKTIALNTLPTPVSSTLAQAASGIKVTEAESKGRRIEVEPFTYDYEQTGSNTARVTVRFPRSGENVVIDYDLRFNADGKGTVVRSDSHGSASGEFSYRNRSGRINKV